jgi:hypothetical protein
MGVGVGKLQVVFVFVLNNQKITRFEKRREGLNGRSCVATKWFWLGDCYVEEK